ncbi:Glycoside hydrolase [Phytophthora megakarya]|uniref:Glycoside hydrolase n=1 Tax=Phytophthora megakarya TaxID=4795 RepID=A0A225VGT8_9STRA|nr:Glycoside hydrolase [Phytophthora megakarya]
MLFIIQPYISLNVPEMKQLEKLSEISLDPDQTQSVNFTLTADDWSVYYLEVTKVAEYCEYVMAIKPEAGCDVYNSTAVANRLCATSSASTRSERLRILTMVFGGWPRQTWSLVV